MAHTVKVMSILTCTSSHLSTTKICSVHQIPNHMVNHCQATDSRSFKFKGYMGYPSTFATTGVNSDNSLSRTGVSVLFL